MTNIVIASAARTAVGSFSGAFANTPAHELGAAVIKAALARAGVDCVLIGHNGHPEVEGTMGQYNSAQGGQIYLVEDVSDVNSLQISDPRELQAAYRRGIETVKAGEPYLIDVITQPR